MASSNPLGNILLIGGVGVAAWWLYDSYFATPATAGAAAPGSPATSAGAGGSVTTSHSPAPSSDGGSTGGVSTPPPNNSVTTMGPPEYVDPTTLQSHPLPPTLSTFGEPVNYSGQGGATLGTPDTLTGLYLDMLAWAANSPAFSYTSVGPNPGFSATPYQWATLMKSIWPNPPSPYTGGSPWPPDPKVVFPAANLSALMNGTDWWNTMMPYLQARGLSGFGLGEDPSGTGLPDCGTVSPEAGFVGPVNCVPTTGQVEYLPSATQIANLYQQLQGQISQLGTQVSSTNWMPWAIGGVAIFALAGALGGGRR